MTDDRQFRFDSPPLLEAIFEASLVPNLSEALRVAAAQRLIGHYFRPGKGELQELEEFQVVMAVSNAGVTPVGPSQQKRFQVWNESKDQVLQFSNSLASFNLLSSAYRGYEKHRDQMKDFFHEYLAVYAPPQILFLGQRFLNQVLLPAEQMPESMFRIYPQLPLSLKSAHRPFAVQIQTESLKDNGNVTLSLTYQGLRDGQHLYILDIYARSGPMPDAQLEWHDEAHEAIRRAFSLAFTTEGLNSFREET